MGDFVHQAITNGKIRMMTTGKEKRQFIHIQDVCEGLHYILENNLSDAVYDLTSFEWSTVRHIADIVALHTKAKIISNTQKGSTRNITTIKGKPFGWNSKISLSDGIKMMVEKQYCLKIKSWIKLN